MRQTGGFGTLLGALVGVWGLVGTLIVGLGAMPAMAAPASHAAAASVGTKSAAAVADFGNPAGHSYVPSAGRAVNTRHPNHVIGNGRPASCTSAAVVRDVAVGGIITFNCGPKPVTVVMTATASVTKTRRLVVLDGGGLITLSGGGKRRILYSDTCAGTWSTDDCVNQPYPQIVVQNITFEDGYNDAHQATCTANIPTCWYGGVDGGGAIYVEGGQFKAVNSRFLDNRCYTYGPDLGGGAIRALAQYKNRPVYITDDTFRGGRCSNGGALSSISVQWDVLNSQFTNNKVGRTDLQRVASAQRHQRGVPDLPRHLLRHRWERHSPGDDQVHRQLILRTRSREAASGGLLDVSHDGTVGCDDPGGARDRCLPTRRTGCGGHTNRGPRARCVAWQGSTDRSRAGSGGINPADRRHRRHLPHRRSITSRRRRRDQRAASGPRPAPGLTARLIAGSARTGHAARRRRTSWFHRPIP
jgi:hypothetical protein